MHIVALAWMFVVVLMTLAEATSTQGTVLGALFTFLLYGVMPLGIVLYVMGAPARGRSRRAAAQADAAMATAAAAGDAGAAAAPPDPTQPASAPQGDGRGQAAGAGLTAERKET
jgi:predicted membrane channel-forming protein YqfA (hemolysin III family)